jgi:hypothetical protein
VGVLAVSPTRATNLFAGLTGGPLFHSIDAARTWSRTELVDVLALAVDETDATLVWAGFKDGAWRSTDGGTTWKFAPGLDGSVTTLVSSPSQRGTFYAGVDNRVFVVSNEGAWTAAGVLTGKIEALIVAPRDPSLVWAAVAGAGVVRTVDAGGTWTPFNAGLGSMDVTRLAADPGSSDAIFAASRGGGLWRSKRDGPWVALTTAWGDSDVIDIVVARARVDRLFVATTTDVFRTDDGGKTWASDPGGQPLSGVTRLVVDPKDGDGAYAGTRDAGVWKRPSL